jgi:hypothetical protein
MNARLNWPIGGKIKSKCAHQMNFICERHLFQPPPSHLTVTKAGGDK